MNITKLRVLGLISILAVAIAATPTAVAGATPPDTVNYQGVLRGSSGAPLNGDRDMVFRFFDDETAGNEVLIDEHLAAGTGAVGVSDGLFSVALGSGSIADGTGPGTYLTLRAVFWQYGEVWLQVTVGGEDLTPRVRIHSAAYATNAAQASNADLLGNRLASSYIDNSSTEQTKTGNLYANWLGTTGGYLYMKATGPGTSQSLYFNSGGNPTAENFSWVSGDDYFHLSDALDLSGPISVRNTGGGLPAFNRFGNHGREATEIDDLDDLLVSGSLEVDGGLFLGNQLYMDDNGIADDQFIYFADLGSRSAEWLKWDTVASRFEVSDDLEVAGTLTATGDILIDSDLIQFSGGSESLFWNPTYTRFEFSRSLEVQGALDVDHTLRVHGNELYLNRSGPDADTTIYFWDNGLYYGDYLRWNESEDRFDTSNDLKVFGTLRVTNATVPSMPYSVFGNSNATDARISSISDVYVAGDLQTGGAVIPNSVRGIDGFYLDMKADHSLRFVFDDDNSTVGNYAAWYHDGDVTTAHKVMELQEDGDLRIAGVLSQSVSFDLAETFLASQSLHPGDLVALDPARPGAVRLSSGDGDGTVLGVVSAKPGVLLGSAPFDAGALRETWGNAVADQFEAELVTLRPRLLQSSPDIRGALEQLEQQELVIHQEFAQAEGVENADLAALQDRLSSATTSRREIESELDGLCLEQFYSERFVPVALAGRVPVKVDASAAPIAPGDLLAPGATPGVARRAGSGDPVIGTALEGLASGRGELLVFVHRGGAVGSTSAATAAAHDELAQTIDERTPDPVSGVQTMESNLQVVLDQGADDSARFSIFRDGHEDGALAAELLRVDENGDVLAAGAFRPDAMDVAEFFPVGESIEPGDVLVADRLNPGALVRSADADDPAVVGVVSTTPGVLLGSGIRRVAAANPQLAAQLQQARALGDRDEEARLTTALETEFRRTHAAVAMTGTVPCKVDAGYGPIRVGDLLTTSPTPGHAMHSADALPGTILGKALEPLDSGTGTIRIVVMLR